MSTRSRPATESAKNGLTREEAYRKAVERAENEGMAEPPEPGEIPSRGWGAGIRHGQQKMNDDDRKLMQALGITVSRKNVYSYKGFRYEWLDDAIRYAEIDTRRDVSKDTL